MGCVYLEAADAVVLIDPLVPPEDSDRFWTALDADVERAARPVAVLLTTESHGRSTEEIIGRYGGGVRSADGLPAGVEAIDARWGGELLYWLTDHNALVAGDVLHGAGAGGVRLADAWLGDERAAVRAALLPVLDLPVERLLVTHGEPVLENGRDALARALGAHAPSAS